jgi:SAM-dependent methyltransferase
LSSRDPTARFSDRVDSYVRARPSYPVAVLDAIEEETARSGPLSVADVGSGTGIFTKLLLERGHTVYAVEPNAPMRTAAERDLGANPYFRSVDGKAEATRLADASVDLVTAAQAFHWFDRDAARVEWSRILRPPRWAALLWNDRRSEPGFGSAYEEFLKEWGGEEYRRVRWSWAVGDTLGKFFGPDGFRERTVTNKQELDLAGVQGRLLSSSYLPGPDDSRREPMLAAAAGMFERFQNGGTVVLSYETKLYVGRL